MHRSRPDAGDRIVDAAVARLHEQGITVALDGISLEEAIAASGVSRATGYRRWPNRAEFLREVLVRVVRAAQLEPEGHEELDAIRTMVTAQRDGFSTATGRRTVAIEGLRIAADADYRRLATSREWRDYLALRATCDGLRDRELRDTLTGELRTAEREFARHRAAVYSQLPRLLGYRLVPPLTGELGFTVMAETMGALMTGLVVRAAVEETTPSFRGRAFGSSIESEWTTASYSLVAALVAYLEPDPAVEWDDERVAASIARFDELEDVIETSRRRSADQVDTETVGVARTR
jgi:AcrR family transcriptional regulator